MSSIKRIIIICLTTLIILPMGVRAGYSVSIGGIPNGTGGRDGGGNIDVDYYALQTSPIIRFSLVEKNTNNVLSSFYYIMEESPVTIESGYKHNWLKDANYIGKNIIYLSAYDYGTSYVAHGSVEGKSKYISNRTCKFWEGKGFSGWGNGFGGNVNASNINTYLSNKQNFYTLLAELKIGTYVWDGNVPDHTDWVKEVFEHSQNEGQRNRLLKAKNYYIAIEPVYSFVDSVTNPSKYFFATTKGYALYVDKVLHKGNKIIGFGLGGFCYAAETVHTGDIGNNGESCNIRYIDFADFRNGYGKGVINIVEDNLIPACDPNTQCCYNATGNNIVQNGTHYNDSNGKRQPCCDKKKSCCYSAPNDNSYHREFSDDDDYDDVRYKKVNNSFKECSNCKPKVTTTSCSDNPKAASIVESDKVDICTFDKSKKSGIKLSSGGNDVTAACRDELIVNTPGKKDTSSYKSGNYFILDKGKNLMPSISVKRQCYVKKDSSFNENLQKTKLDIKKAPKVNFYYDNDEESKNDIAKSFSFSPEITRLDTTYYDLGNNYNNSNKTLISDVSNVSSNNYVLREETMDITYKSKAYVKALTGKVTYIKPSDSDIDSYYESEDNSVFVSYKTKNSTYNYTLKFDFGNLGNDNLKEELKENKLFKNDDNNNYTCTYLVKNNLVINGEKLNYFYRTVDLDNINHKNRKLGSNWETTKYDNKNDCIIKNKDQASRKSCLVQLDMKNKEKSYKELTEQGDSYSFRLTPTDMKAIRKYNVERNKNSDGFNDFNLEKYDNPNYKYIFYTSNFLTCISGSECKNLGTSLNNYLDGKDRNNQINSIRNSLVSKLDDLENITK